MWTGGQLKKIVFIGDVQLDDRTPRMRKDDYCLAIIKKLNWIFQWCVHNKIDRIYFLGDLFNRKEVGGRARNLLIRLFKKFHDQDGFPDCYITIGNHDTSNDLNNLKTSTLWTLIQIGYLKYTEYDPEFRVAFVHNYVKVDRDITEKGLHHKDALIWSVHASLYPNEYEYALNFNDIDITGPAKLFVCGHIHSSYTCKRKDGRILINPGHIGRNAYNETIPGHKVQILYVEHDGENILKKQLVPVETALDYKEVFDIERINLQAHIKDQVKKIVHDNSSVDTYEGIHDIDTVIEFAKKTIKNKNVVELITKFLGEANS